jgi:nucleotide-binding universal stress UspA family protein
MKKIIIKKVLIALDYSPTAQKIAETGFSMAKTMGAEVVLLHVITDLVQYSISYLNMGPLQLDSAEGIITASQQFLEKTRKHLGDESILLMVREGDFAETILNTAKELKTDVLVMGSHSKRWLEDIIMGSVTEKVINHITIPLLIIPVKQKK